VTPPSGKVIFWIAMHTLNWIQNPQELISCHICIHKPRAYIVLVVKEAAEVNELCIVRNFIKYFHENAASI
jgi:hypothetical protein